VLYSHEEHPHSWMTSDDSQQDKGQKLNNPTLMAKRREGRKAQSTHITVYMCPSNLPRVMVGICNRPRGRHAIRIKSQSLRTKSLSQD